MDTEDGSMEKLIDKMYEILLFSPEEFDLFSGLMVESGNPRYIKLISEIQRLRGE